MPTSAGSRRSSHAIRQLSVTKDDSFEEEEESEEEEVRLYNSTANLICKKFNHLKRYLINQSLTRIIVLGGK